MARLQILQLPEGAGDRRPPFVLVVDQMEPQRYILSEGMKAQPDQWDVVAKQIGARGSIVVPDTIDIPANDVPPLPLLSAEADDKPDVDYTEMIETVDRVLGINSGRGKPDVAGWLLTACRELEKSEDARAHLRSERDSLKTRLQQVQQTPLGPDAMDAGLEHPNVWLHGYRAGVLAAKAAARSRTEAVVAPQGLTKEDVMDVIAQGLDRESRQMRRGTP
ncbi:hypothetical protein AB0M61_01445 [Streptomyces sp. NPDC051642]|uniref:hypothetical protein n=1 Tax=Streptomyces sp. NPDC051642 TaxID=3154646 RepID=UPI003416865B